MSRAHRRVQGAAAIPDTTLTHQREIVNAFFAAARGGDFEALPAALDPDVVFYADHAAMQAGGPKKEVRGAPAVARLFSGRAQIANPALVNGAVGIVVAPRGQLFLVIVPTIVNGKIVEIEVIADPEHLSRIDLAVINS